MLVRGDRGAGFRLTYCVALAVVSLCAATPALTAQQQPTAPKPLATSGGDAQHGATGAVSPTLAGAPAAAATATSVPAAPAASASSIADTPSSTLVADALGRVVHDTVLANGLQVIAIENHSTKLVTVEIVFRTGAFTQEPGDQGVPHLYEHMLFKSYSGPNGRPWGESMSDIDGTYNGETADESVRYHVSAPSDNAEGAMRALAELVRDPEFSQDDLNEERRVVLDELDRARSNPFQNLNAQVEQRLWTTAWGRKDAGGDAAALAGVTPKHLEEIFHRYYVPNNAAVIVSGDVTAARAFQLAHERFDHWSRRPDPFAAFTPAVIPPLAQSSAVIVQDEVEDVLILVKWEGPSVTADPEATYAADMLSSVLGDPVSSFHQRLIDSGLFASCGIYYDTKAHVGAITLLAHTSIDRLTPALTVLADVIRTLDAPTSFTDDELIAARQTRRVQLALSLQHRESMAHEIAEFWSSAGLDYFRHYNDHMAAVTRADVQRFAKRYLVGAPMSVGLLVPPGTGNGLKQTVGGFVMAAMPTTQ